MSTPRQLALPIEPRPERPVLPVEAREEAVQAMADLLVDALEVGAASADRAEERADDAGR